MDDEQKKCGGITFFGIVVLGMSIAMIAIGCINIDLDKVSDVSNPENLDTTCNAEPKIPYYLVVGGILMIVLLVIRLFFKVNYFLALKAQKCKSFSLEMLWQDGRNRGGQPML